MLLNQYIRNILISLFVLYYCLNMLYSEGSLLSQICVVTIILISLLYFLKTLLLSDANGLFYTAWTILLLLNIIGFIIDPDFASGRPRDMFKSILGGLLAFYPFYYFAKKNILNSNHLIGFLLIMLPVSILLFLSNQNKIVSERNIDSTDVVNNAAYLFVGLIPFVFLLNKRKFLSLGLMTIILLFVIKGSKRGAIIAAGIGLIVYCYYLIKTLDKQNRVIGYLFVFIVICSLIAFAYKNLMSNELIIVRKCYN